MLDFLAWGLRVAGLVAGVLGGVALYAAAPEADDLGTDRAVERARCRLEAFQELQRDLRRYAAPAAENLHNEALARCPQSVRTAWHTAGRNLGLGLLFGGVAGLVVSAALASAARRERLAEELLAEARNRGASEPPSVGR